MVDNRVRLTGRESTRGTLPDQDGPVSKQRKTTRGRPGAPAAGHRRPVGADVRVTESRPGVLLAAIGVPALGLAMVVGSQSDAVEAVVDPGPTTQLVLWRTAVIVLGAVATLFVVLTMRDMFLPDGRIERYAGPSMIVNALGITGVTTLWAMLVAVSAAGGAVPEDAVGYIGNATVLGLLLGLAVVGVTWVVSAVGAFVELVRYGDRSKLPAAVGAVVVVGGVLLAYPVWRSFQG